jgi:transposase
MHLGRTYRGSKRALHGSLTASRCNPVLSAFYDSLIAKGKQPKLALVAVARKILTILTAMLRTGQTWNPKHP